MGVKEGKLKSNNGITKKGNEIHQSLQTLRIIPQNLKEAVGGGGGKKKVKIH